MWATRRRNFYWRIMVFPHREKKNGDSPVCPRIPKVGCYFVLVGDLLSYELGGETNPHLDFVCALLSLGDFPEYGTE
jgi:hypothetical protein